MAAGQFYFTNPEAARQAIAEMQVGAAAAENASRERIAKEQTASQRYATQSQIAENEKNRAVDREEIAARSRYGANAVNLERGNIQYSTIRDSITEFDPPTKRELEATMAMSPQLTDDLKNDLRALRDRAYKVAKANAAIGAQSAKNYTAELSVKGLLDAAKANIYERMAKDRNILFDRATGLVESAFQMPREDASPTQSNILGATRPGGFFPSAQEMQALGSATPGAPKVTTLDEIRAQVGSRGTRPLIGALPPTAAGLVTPAAPMPRMADIAPPPPMEPGWFTVPPELMPPSGAAAPAENRLLQILSKMPEFAMLPPAGKQMVMDQVTGGLMAMPEPIPPRASEMSRRFIEPGDFQTLRQEFVPMDDRYVAPH